MAFSSNSEFDPVQHIAFDKQSEGAVAGMLSRPQSGFAWRRDYVPAERQFPRGLAGLPDYGPWLVPKFGADRSSQYTEIRYPVMTEGRCRDLHRKFAKLARDRRPKLDDKIRAFADVYGYLSAEQERVYLHLRPELPAALGHFQIGEHLSLWQSEIYEAAALIAIWDLINNPFADKSQLRRYIQVIEHPRQITVYVAWENGRLSASRGAVDWHTTIFGEINQDGVEQFVGETVADERDQSGRLRLQQFPELKRGKPDLEAAARLWLYDQINHKLWGRVSRQLVAGRAKGDQVRDLPHSLLGAIYLHFLQDIEGRPGTGTPCGNPRCGKLIDTSFGRRYCNDKCRDQARNARNQTSRAVRQ